MHTSTWSKQDTGPCWQGIRGSSATGMMHLPLLFSEDGCQLTVLSNPCSYTEPHLPVAYAPAATLKAPVAEAVTGGAPDACK
jgi:hypothetical protein